MRCAGRFGSERGKTGNMGKGPGHWQREILANLEEHDFFLLTDILPDGHTDADYKALLRAAATLSEHGRLVRWNWGKQRLVAKPGVTPNGALPVLNVDNIRDGKSTFSFQDKIEVSSCAHCGSSEASLFGIDEAMLCNACVRTLLTPVLEVVSDKEREALEALIALGFPPHRRD